MRSLGLDHGKVRIGVAISDPLGITALPLEFIKNNKEAIKAIIEVIKKYSVSKVVLGMPRKMDGKEGEAAENVRKFGKEVSKASGVELEYWDERLTSKMAEKGFIEAGMSREKRRSIIDSTAAAIMLQGYMDAKRNEKKA
jgi:putative Holliday junction resolvase